MYQQQIQFFWPLTEQIPLDLDYTRCEKPKIYCDTLSNQLITTTANDLSWAATVHVDKVETREICFTLNKNPGKIKGLVYKFLGIDWKVK